MASHPSTPIAGMDLDQAKQSYVLATVDHVTQLAHLSGSMVVGMTTQQRLNEYRNIVVREQNLGLLRDHIKSLQGGRLI